MLMKWQFNECNCRFLFDISVESFQGAKRSERSQHGAYSHPSNAEVVNWLLLYLWLLSLPA